MTADFNNAIRLENDLLITLDVVGSIGHSLALYSEVSSVNTTDNILALPMEQRSRKFSITNRTCSYNYILVLQFMHYNLKFLQLAYYIFHYHQIPIVI